MGAEYAGPGHNQRICCPQEEIRAGGLDMDGRLLFILKKFTNGHRIDFKPARRLFQGPEAAKFEGHVHGWPITFRPSDPGRN